MQILGQVYNPVYQAAEGDKKERFSFSLGHRNAYSKEGDSMIFTPCVTFQIAKVMNENFGKAEHHGKPILVTGHMNEYTWQPDASNPNHKRYVHPVTISAENLAQAGFIIGAGSPASATFMIATPQHAREFIISGFEFVGYPMPAKQNVVAAQQPANGAVVIVASGAQPQQQGIQPVVGQQGMPFVVGQPAGQSPGETNTW